MSDIDYDSDTGILGHLSFSSKTTATTNNSNSHNSSSPNNNNFLSSSSTAAGRRGKKKSTKVKTAVDEESILMASIGSQQEENATSATAANIINRVRTSSSHTVPIDQYSVRPGKWKFIKEIGYGSFGTVYSSLNSVTGVMMAVKKMSLLSTNSCTISDIQREVDLMRELSHPNIVQYYGAEVDEEKGYLYIFQELVTGGSIAGLLQTTKRLSIPVIQSYLYQVLEGLAYLHSKNIVHRDIKGGNILISNDGILKIADFGASKQLFTDQSSMEMTMKGTPYFMAPEVCFQRYGKKADIWSVGGVALQMCTGSPPWKEMKFTNHFALFNHIKESAHTPKVSREIRNSALRELIQSCFQRDPSKRPTAKTLQRHSFFFSKNDDSDEDTYVVSHTEASSLPEVVTTGLAKTPRVDVGAASKRALLKSQEKYRAASYHYELEESSSHDAESRNEHNNNSQDDDDPTTPARNLNTMFKQQEVNTPRRSNIVVVVNTSERDDAVSPLSSATGGENDHHNHGIDHLKQKWMERKYGSPSSRRGMNISANKPPSTNPFSKGGLARNTPNTKRLVLPTISKANTGKTKKYEDNGQDMLSSLVQNLSISDSSVRKSSSLPKLSSSRRRR